MTLCLPKRIMINELKSNGEILWCVLSSGIIWIHLLSPGWSQSLPLSTLLPFRWTYTIMQTFTFHISAINQHLQQSVSLSDGGAVKQLYLSNTLRDNMFACVKPLTSTTVCVCYHLFGPRSVTATWFHLFSTVGNPLGALQNCESKSTI